MKKRNVIIIISICFFVFFFFIKTPEKKTPEKDKIPKIIPVKILSKSPTIAFMGKDFQYQVKIEGTPTFSWTIIDSSDAFSVSQNGRVLLKKSRLISGRQYSCKVRVRNAISVDIQKIIFKCVKSIKNIKVIKKKPPIKKKPKIKPKKKTKPLPKEKKKEKITKKERPKPINKPVILPKKKKLTVEEMKRNMAKKRQEILKKQSQKKAVLKKEKALIKKMMRKKHEKEKEVKLAKKIIEKLQKEKERKKLKKTIERGRKVSFNFDFRMYNISFIEFLRLCKLQNMKIVLMDMSKNRSLKTPLYFVSLSDSRGIVTEKHSFEDLKKLFEYSHKGTFVRVKNIPYATQMRKLSWENKDSIMRRKFNLNSRYSMVLFFPYITFAELDRKAKSYYNQKSIDKTLPFKKGAGKIVFTFQQQLKIVSMNNTR